MTTVTPPTPSATTTDKVEIDSFSVSESKTITMRTQTPDGVEMDSCEFVGIGHDGSNKNNGQGKLGQSYMIQPCSVFH